MNELNKKRGDFLKKIMQGSPDTKIEPGCYIISVIPEMELMAEKLNLMLWLTTKEERKKIIEKLSEGFCPRCWKDNPLGICFCNNDE